MKKIVIFNGPPNSGKDLFASELSKIYPKSGHYEIKNKLFDLALTISSLDQTQWDKFYTRELKELPNELLFGMSPREFLINISENCIKPIFGNNYFSVAAAKQFKNSDDEIAFYSDGGFDEELKCMVEEFGAENVLIFSIYREGCSFDNDSRNYYKPVYNVINIKIDNNSSKEDAINTIEMYVNRFLNMEHTNVEE